MEFTRVLRQLEVKPVEHLGRTTVQEYWMDCHVPVTADDRQFNAHFGSLWAEEENEEETLASEAVSDQRLTEDERKQFDEAKDQAAEAGPG